MDRETWEFINSFAPWLGGIGSIIAAVVALYLGRSSRTEKLRVSVHDGFRVTISADTWKEIRTRTHVVFEAANIGPVPLTIMRPVLAFRTPRKRHFDLLGFDSETFPKKLEPGEVMCAEISLLFWHGCLRHVFHRASIPLLGAMIGGRTSRVGFRTASGRVFLTTPPRSIAREITTFLRQSRHRNR